MGNASMDDYDPLGFLKLKLLVAAMSSVAIVVILVLGHLTEGMPYLRGALAISIFATCVVAFFPWRLLRKDDD